MKRIKRSFDEINTRCLILESLGFEINNADDDVEMFGVNFDFSAIELTTTNILYHALATMQKEARKEGRNEVRDSLVKLLEIEE